MRRIRYQVAASLDGYIAGPNGEFDWIVMDPEIDFKALVARFDTILVGRHSYEVMDQDREGKPVFGMNTVVVSRTLDPATYPHLTVLGDGAEESIHDLRAQDGKDIWLFGGGVLFRSLLEAGLVDSVEVAVIPILLGGGIPLFPPPAPRAPLTLKGHRRYEKTGTLLLEYAVGAREAGGEGTA